MKFQVRDVPPRAAWTLEQAGLHPLLARLLAARGVQQAEEMDDQLKHLLPPDGLRGMAEASALLQAAIAQQRRICVVADYDCDGATACAVALRGLRMLGARHVDYLVPDRVADGYGLTASIARRVKAKGADLLITVDNGIASVEGVQVAREAGLQVLITDPRLPGQTLPQADATVNPNQPGWFGFTMASAAGSRVSPAGESAHRWWSVTTTCKPQAFACATPSSEAMPLSTVTSSCGCSASASSTMAGVSP